MNVADEKVARWIVRQFRETHRDGAASRERHLAACPDAVAERPEGSDGTAGCDTGCPYVELYALIRCPHGHSVGYTYGDYGDLALLLEEIEAEG